MSTTMEMDAVITPCGTYRYSLTRRWDPQLTACVFVMLNPSTADAEQDDPTIRRCIGFAKSWGFGGLIVRNIFALRATDPATLRSHPDPIGPDNDTYLWQVRDRLIVAAWGVHGALNGRGDAARRLLGANLRVLGLTKDGHPKHPLYLRADSKPVLWTPTPNPAA